MSDAPMYDLVTSVEFRELENGGATIALNGKEVPWAMPHEGRPTYEPGDGLGILWLPILCAPLPMPAGDRP